MIPDIYTHPEQYYFIQFTTDANGYMHPISAHPFMLQIPVRYPDYPFLRPSGSSKFGHRRLKNATQWAIVHISNDAQRPPTVLHRGAISSIGGKKKIIPFGHGTDYYFIASGTKHYMHIMVSRHQQVPSATTTTTTTEDHSS